MQHCAFVPWKLAADTEENNVFSTYLQVPRYQKQDFFFFVNWNFSVENVTAQEFSARRIHWFLMDHRTTKKKKKKTLNLTMAVGFKYVGINHMSNLITSSTLPF